MIINIKPIDVLFFRDSKPFARGSEHFASSIFPPYPQTLYGALRTKVLEELGCDFDKFKNNQVEFRNKNFINKLNIKEEVLKRELGTVENLGTFKLQGPLLLFKDDCIYVKCPFDVKKLDDNNYKILTPFEWEKVSLESDFNLSNYPHTFTDKILEDVSGYISLRDLIDFYLLNQKNNCKIIPHNEIFVYEPRVGIALNPQTNTTEEGKLYMVNYVRLKDDWSFYAKIENLSALPKEGAIRFGGASRVCYYKTLENDPFRFYTQENVEQKLKERISQTKEFKLVFLTPTIFKNGWLPNNIKFESNNNNYNYILETPKIKAKLLTACLERPKYISGWDIANKKPKPLKKLVPAGSVYYFELIGGSVDDLFNEFNFKNFSDENPNLGFGLTMIGGV